MCGCRAGRRKWPGRRPLRLAHGRCRGRKTWFVALLPRWKSCFSWSPLTCLLPPCCCWLPDGCPPSSASSVLCCRWPPSAGLLASYYCYSLFTFWPMAEGAMLWLWWVGALVALGCGLAIAWLCLSSGSCVAMQSIGAVLRMLGEVHLVALCCGLAFAGCSWLAFVLILLCVLLLSPPESFYPVQEDLRSRGCAGHCLAELG